VTFSVVTFNFASAEKRLFDINIWLFTPASFPEYHYYYLSLLKYDTTLLSNTTPFVTCSPALLLMIC